VVQLFRGPDKISTEQYKKTIEGLEADRQKLEEELGQRSPAFRAEQQSVPLEQTQHAVPAGAALLAAPTIVSRVSSALLLVDGGLDRP